MADSVKEQVGDLVSQGKRRVGLEKPSAADDDGRVGIARGLLRAFGEGDHDGFLDGLRDDVVWEAPEGKHFPGAGEQEGREAIRKEFIGNIGRTFTAFGFRPDTYVDADDADSVLVIGRFEGEGVEGARLEEPGVLAFVFEGNAVAKVRIFTDTAGFPEVVTERKEKEWEEEDREKEEKEKEESSDDGDGEAKASAKDDSGDEERDDSDSDEGGKNDDERRNDGSDG